MSDSALKVNFQKRQQLERILGAGHLNYCYQCGACVGDCPTARFHPEFNPRTIMLQSLLGDLDELLAENSLIWHCSNCYNCYERCPQDVRPVEVIIALKNLCVAEGTAAEDIQPVLERILATGRSVPVMPAVNRMREQMGLPPLAELDTSELQEILKPDDEA